MTKREKAEIIILGILVIFLSLVSCKKGSKEEMNVCIQPDKYTDTINGVITVTNCGDTPPSMITLTIDWGDGTAATSGITGTHKYTKAGTFTIRLMGNGEPASEKIGSADKVERKVTIN